jgi:O-antigen biosynthesis protein
MRTFPFSPWRPKKRQALFQRLSEAKTLSFSIKICVPAVERQLRHFWGDHHLALSLVRELEARGHRAAVEIIPDWFGVEARSADIALHLHGLKHYQPRAHQLNVQWILSHPERITRRSASGFDLVLAASEPFAEHLWNQHGIPAETLLQFTDPGLFHTGDEGLRENDLLFVGNSRKIARPLAVWAAHSSSDRQLTVFGRDWEGILPSDCVAGEYLPYEELRGWYAGAFALLNDHWSDMARWGFVNNRIFDGAGSGAFVISDFVPAIHELFPRLPMCRDGGELDQILERAEHEPEWRREVIEDCHQRTVKHHLVRHRVDRLLESIGKVLSAGV